MSEQSTPISPQKVYRLAGKWRFAPPLILALSLVFSLAFLLLSFTGTRFDIASRIIFLVGAVIIALLGVSVFVGSQQMRL